MRHDEKQSEDLDLHSSEKQVGGRKRKHRIRAEVSSKEEEERGYKEEQWLGCAEVYTLHSSGL